MLQAAVKAAHETAQSENCSRPLVFAVTVLTSISPGMLMNELFVGKNLSEYVAHLACVAYEAGCDGVIASPHEIEIIRKTVSDPNFLVVTPGVRPAGADKGDQARVMTPAEAIRRGANYLVIGRPILAAPNPAEAAQAIADEISGAL